MPRWRHAIAAAALSLAVIVAAVGFGGWFMAQDERLGVVHFPISCGWRSQHDFTTATAQLHLFQFAEAEAAYGSIVRRDPDCAIAYWGIAMSRLQNPLYALPSAKDASVARQALAAADAATTATPRERGYLAAAHVLFEADPAIDWQERETAYAAAMATVARDNPDDIEATIFYALALNLAALPSDRSHANRTQAAELLLSAFADEPDHPGIDHYLTYCLGHSGYQPKPFERASMITPIQRVMLAGLAVLTLSGAGVFVARTAGLSPSVRPAPVIGGPFELTAADGKVVTDRTLRGHWLLVYFGYTHCPGICPMTLTTIAAVLDKLGPVAEKVRPVFITIDPERDTPEAVDAFSKAFDARIIGLTGKPTEIAEAARAYHVFFRKVPGAEPDDYLMEHSSYIFVMDPDGRYVTLFTEDQVEAPDDIVSRLRTLMAPST